MSDRPTLADIDAGLAHAIRRSAKRQQQNVMARQGKGGYSEKDIVDNGLRTFLNDADPMKAKARRNLDDLSRAFAKAATASNKD